MFPLNDDVSSPSLSLILVYVVVVVSLFSFVVLIENKKRHMFSYLAELVFDLAICGEDNVSQSPGFESCGLWKK